MRAGEALAWLNKAAGTYTAATANQSGGAGQADTTGFLLQGGTYQVSIVCTGTPALEVDQLGPDSATWIELYLQPDSAPGTPTQTLVTSGIAAKFTVPPGKYRVKVATSTANYVRLTRIPMSE